MIQIWKNVTIPFALLCRRCQGRLVKASVESSSYQSIVSKRVLMSLFLGIMVLGFSLEAHTQGKIVGKVIDKKTTETLIGATIIIEGTTIGTITDFDGNYTLNNVPAGNHTIICSYVSFTKEKKELTVGQGETVEVNFELSSASLSLDEVIVKAKKIRESENILILEQKEAVLATKAMGAQEISRKGVSDAEGAVTKITGISKQEGVKNVFVRGLGDRYNTTTLNGFVLPSEDPEYKNISLDFFTSDMIQLVSVNKVFSASMNADVGGALIDIRSKELTKDSHFEAKLSSSINTETAGRTFLLPDGFNKFGYSNASYGPHADVNNYSFDASLDPTKNDSPYNGAVSVSWGKQVLNKHRVYVVAAFNNDFSYEQGVSREITATNAASPFKDMTYERYMRNTSHLLMGNLEFNLTKGKLNFNSLYVHKGLAYTADFYGKDSETFQTADDFDSEGFVRRHQINDNSIFINQLIWNGNFSERLTYYAGASFNYLIGKEPDRRIFRFSSIGNNQVEILIGESSNQRFNSEIKEMALIPKFHVQYKLFKESDNVSYIKLGYEGRISNKDFAAPFYNHIWDPINLPSFDVDNIVLDPYYNQENLSAGNFELEYFEDTYDVKRNNHGAYIDVVYQLSNKLILNIGLRGDYVYTKINYEVNRGANIGSNKLDELYISPNVNVKYILNDKNQFRFAASRTYTLPQDKEISPFVFLRFDGNESGNPDLETSTNYNIDFSWEHFISNSELFTLSGFYKYILDPIARVDKANSAGVRTFENISDHAIAAGFEAELRKKILSFAEGKHSFDLGINASYIYSNVDLDPLVFVQNTSSSLEGAAEYIVNADLTYKMTSDKFSVISAVVLNYMSDKVHTIGTRGYNNLVEESIATLDFVNSFKINKHWGISLKAMNLLNPVFKLTREGASEENMPSVVIRSYKKGISFNLGLTYKL